MNIEEYEAYIHSFALPHDILREVIDKYRFTGKWKVNLYNESPVILVEVDYDVKVPTFCSSRLETRTTWVRDGDISITIYGDEQSCGGKPNEP